MTQDALTANEQSQAVEREAAVPGGELLPCPFCGSSVELDERMEESLFSHAIVPYYSITCPECEIMGQSWEDKDEVVTHWNTRPAHRPPQPGVVTEELRRLSEAASPGRAYVAGLPWFQTACGVLVGSPDPHAGYMIAETEGWEGEREEYLANEPAIQIASADEDAAFIAGCWNFVRALLAAPSPGASVTASPAAETAPDAGLVEALKKARAYLDALGHTLCHEQIDAALSRAGGRT